MWIRHLFNALVERILIILYIEACDFISRIITLNKIPLHHFHQGFIICFSRIEKQIDCLQCRFGRNWQKWRSEKGLLLTCQQPSMPQLSTVPCSSWPGCLLVAVTGEGGWRWIRGMTKISPALTPLCQVCHAAKERVITVTFSHFKFQVWFCKAGAHYWCTGPAFKVLYSLLKILFYWN